MKIFFNSIVYDIKSPETHLWSWINIQSVKSLPKLPIGLSGRMVECMWKRVRGIEEDKKSKLYLMVRVSNGRLVKWNRKRFCNDNGN